MGVILELFELQIGEAELKVATGLQENGRSSDEHCELTGITESPFGIA